MNATVCHDGIVMQSVSGGSSLMPQEPFKQCEGDEACILSPAPCVADRNYAQAEHQELVVALLSLAAEMARLKSIDATAI